MPVAEYNLIQAQPGNEHLDRLAEEITRVPEVTKAERVTGPFDVIGEVRQRDAAPPAADSVIRELDGVLCAISMPIVDRAIGSEFSLVPHLMLHVSSANVRRCRAIRDRAPR